MDIKAWAVQHIISALGMASIVGGAAAWLTKKLPAFAEKEIAILDAKLLGRIKNPKLKQFALRIEQAVEEAIPGAGDAKYAALTDLILSEVPAAAPARPLLLAVLSGLGAGAKQGIEDTISQQPH